MVKIYKPSTDTNSSLRLFLVFKKLWVYFDSFMSNSKNFLQNKALSSWKQQKSSE